MNVNCPKCSAAYQVDAARIPLGGIDMKCSRCLHTFEVNPHAPPPGGGQGLKGTGLNLPGVTFLGQSAGSPEESTLGEKFFIQRQSGKVFGPFEKRLILQMLKAGKLSGQEGVSRDKSFWVPMSAVPEFQAFLASSASDPRGQTFLGLPGVGGAPLDPPTVEVPGFQELAQAVSMAGSPWGDSSGVAELPGVRGPSAASMAGFPELPAPARDANLSGFMAPELPGLPLGPPAAELPAPARSPWGDASGLVELPGLTSYTEAAPSEDGFGAELPGLPGGVDLPGLPGAQLPRARGGSAELPGLPGAQLPRARGGSAELPGLPGAQLPQSRGGSAELPGLPGAQLPQSRGGVERGAAGRCMVRSCRSRGAVLSCRAYTGRSCRSRGVRWICLCRVRGGSRVARSCRWRRRGARSCRGARRGSRARQGGPQPARGPAHLPASKGFGGGDDLFDDEDMEGAFGAFDANRGVEPVGGAEGDSVDLRKTLGHAPAVSLGVPPELGDEADQEGAAASAGAGKKKKVKARRSKKSSLVLSAAIALLACSLVIVMALIVWQTGVLDEYLGGEVSVSAPGAPVEEVKPVAAKGLEERLRADSWKTHRDFVEGTTNLANAAPQDASLKGRLVLGHVLLLAHYPEEEGSRKEVERLLPGLGEGAEGDVALGRGAQKVLAGDIAGARALLEPLLKGDDQDQVYFAHLLLGLQAWMVPDVGVELGDAEPAQEAPASAPASEEGAEGAPPAGDKGEVMDFVEEGSPAEAPPAEAPPEAAVKEAIKERKDLLAESLRHLAAAAELQPAAPAPVFFQGALSQRAGDLDKARGRYEEALGRDGAHVPSLLERSRVAYLTGRLDGVNEGAQKILGELAERSSKRERSQAQLLLGLGLSARRETKGAAEAMIESLKIDPTNPDALKALGEEFFRAGRFEDALTYYTTNAGLSQTDPEVMLGVVKSFTGLNKLSEASQKLEAGAKAFPTDPRFPFFLGLIKEKEGDWAGAEKQYRSANQVDPSFSRGRVRLALLLLRDGKKEEASALLTEAEQAGALRDPAVAVDIGQAYLLMGREEKALQALNRALRLNASNLDARVRLARYHLDTGKPDKALELLSPFMKSEVDDPELRILLADIYRAKKEYERAIEQLDRLIEREPKNAEYLYRRGLVYFDWENYETARKQFLKAYSLDPNFSDAHFYIGRVDFATNDYAQAMKSFRAVLDEDQTNGEYRFYMGFALERSGNLTQALEEYRSLERFSPEYAKKNVEFYYRRGRIQALQGNYKRAKEDLGVVLEQNNQHFGALVALGDTFFDERKYPQAVELFARALKQNDEVAYVHYRLGLAYRFLKQRDEALSELERAIALGLKEPSVHRLLGFDYRDLGQSGRAVASFKKYLELSPDASDEKEIEAQIQRLGGRL
jgi:predicted Zn finger-like uncharacterized protein